jgi:acetyl esterase
MTQINITKTIGIGGQLDPEVQTFLKSFNNSLSSTPEIPFKDIPPHELRQAPSVTEQHDLPPEKVEVENHVFMNREGNDIALRIYRKYSERLAAPLLFFHGGCWVFCNLDSHDSICRKLCYETGRTVISVDYRLAPEHKFPKGLNDCYDAAKWTYHHKDSLKLTDKKLVLCGDSAGGNLAAAVSLMARESGDFKVEAQILFYPITNISKADTQSYQKYEKHYFLTKETVVACGEYYTSNDKEKQHNLVSPLLVNDLSVLPKTLIQTAEYDILRDEAEAFANKLNRAGVEVTCVRYNGLIHAYLAFAGSFEKGKQALLDAIQFIKKLSA